MKRLYAIITTAVVIGIALTMLLGFLVGDDFGFLTIFVVNTVPTRAITQILLRLVVITVAVTIMLGVFNLFGVHIMRVARLRRGWHNSLFLLLSAILVFALTIAERLNLFSVPSGQPAPSVILLESVQISIEAALAALLLFALVYGAYRMMRRRVTWGGLLFILSLLIVLLGSLPLPGAGLSFLSSARNWWLAVPVSAGARGILLGIALATLVAGVRVIIGQDRSYRE